MSASRQLRLCALSSLSDMAYVRMFITSQSGMYATLMEMVDRFRVFIGAPDVDKFNIVLLGGT